MIASVLCVWKRKEGDLFFLASYTSSRIRIALAKNIWWPWNKTSMKSSQSKYKVLYDKYSRDLKDRNKNAHKGNELATKGFCF